MSSLVLDSLEIENFRAFRHLKINHLGRINLIVGKNNVGKSCLLEALWLYSRRGNPAVIWEILGTRDEGRVSQYEGRISQLRDSIKLEERLRALKYLFHGRIEIREQSDNIIIGPVTPEGKKLLIDLSWQVTETKADGTKAVSLLNREQYKARVASGITTITDAVPYLASIYIGGSHGVNMYSLTEDNRHLYTPDTRGSEELNCTFVAARGLSRLQIGQLWDNIALTDLEEDVLAALRLIAPNVERINLIADKEPFAQRSTVVKYAGANSPVPLRSMGEGMSRIFGIVLALVNAKDGLLLIDEIDTGIHYSVQPDMWRLIFEVAHRLNVQVFATSHSWDCIQAFQQAADENTQEEGVLIRLQNNNGDVVPVLFDEEELNVVAREMIEVR